MLKSKLEDILIRQFQPEDAEATFEAIQESLAEVSKWLPNLNDELTLDSVRAYIAGQPRLWTQGEAYNFVIVDGKNGRILGGCGLTTIHPLHRYANLYYWVRSRSTGRGVATRAVRMLSGFALHETGLQRVEIVVAVGNEASKRVAEKAGAHLEGVLRQRLRDGERNRDAYMFSLIKSDLET